MLSPIVLFVYNRPNHTRQTLAYLSKNPEAAQSELFIFSDGPRTETDIASVAQTRDVIRKIQDFKKVEILEQAENLGLAKSIISGVTEIIRGKDTVIVLEDDIVVSPFFLKYMNSALAHYRNEDKVACIHAWNYPVRAELPDTFFLKGADCWGWATWKRAWQFFEADGKKLLSQLELLKLTHRFDLDGAYPYTQMLRDQVAGKVNSWAIRWHASAFLRDMVTLHPGKSLVKNIGLDGTGVHSGPDNAFETEISTCDKWKFPADPIEDLSVRRKIAYFLQKRKFRSKLKGITAKFIRLFK